MELPRIQYITHPDENFEDLSWVHRLHEAGVSWIQLRIKEEDVIRRFPEKHYLAYFHAVADSMRVITSALGMILTVNDSDEVARFSHSDGLHIGQDDDHTADLQSFGILGGTASSLEEAVLIGRLPLTYFGIGPLRATETKKKLKPVLGFEGYRSVISGMKSAGMGQPVFAIGGIVPSDIKALFDAGAYGIALSGAIFSSGHALDTIRAFTNEIDNYGTENRR